MTFHLCLSRALLLDIIDCLLVGAYPWDILVPTLCVSMRGGVTKGGAGVRYGQKSVEHPKRNSKREKFENAKLEIRNPKKLEIQKSYPIGGTQTFGMRGVKVIDVA